MQFTLRKQMALVVLFIILKSASVAFSDDRYWWDFTTQHFDNISLAPHGKAAIKLLDPQPGGLHIAIPAGEKIKFSGFTPRFQVSGDFEITLGWSIKSLKKPTAGYGSGPSLYLTTAGEHQPAASLSRLIRADGRSVYSVFIAREVEGERKVSVRLFDTNKESGRLRISRKGTALEFAVLESSSEMEYKVLDEQEFTNATLNLLRAGLQQSDSTARSEIIVPWFSINATNLPHLPSEQDRTEPLYAPRYNPPPQAVSYAWLWQSVLAMCIAGAMLYWFIQRRR